MLLGAPILNLLIELNVAWSARSADEALGSAFIIVPVLLIMLATTVAVLITAVRRRREGVLPGVALSLATVPAILLIAWTSELFGWPRRGRDVTTVELLVLVGGFVIALSLLLLFRKRVLAPGT
jgi:uncharacterized membrane protein YhaH (DUF805 family)